MINLQIMRPQKINWEKVILGEKFVKAPYTKPIEHCISCKKDIYKQNINCNSPHKLGYK